MKLLLILLALGIIVLIGSMIVMWYVIVLGFILLIGIVSLSFWLTVMLVDALTNNIDLARDMGFVVAATILMGLVFLAYKIKKVDH